MSLPITSKTVIKGGARRYPPCQGRNQPTPASQTAHPRWPSNAKRAIGICSSRETPPGAIAARRRRSKSDFNGSHDDTRLPIPAPTSNWQPDSASLSTQSRECGLVSCESEQVLDDAWAIVRLAATGSSLMNPFDAGYWREDELREFGFTVGSDVMVAKNCTIIGLRNETFENISFGDHVRIDGFTTIAAAGGYLTLGSYIHIAGYCFLACSGGVTLEDFSAVSHHGSIYSASDDYSGAALTNPTVPREFLNVYTAPVRLGRHVLIGSGSVILPGVEIAIGSAVGALSLVTRSLPEWGLYGGSPAKLIKPRRRHLEAMEAELLSRNSLWEDVPLSVPPPAAAEVSSIRLPQGGD